MFIRWGLYSIPAGSWNGKPVPDIGEWIMNNASIPVADYEALAKKFNPQSFSARQIVAVAKAAGMKYIVSTAKHYDRFAMFKSQADPFNIVDATAALQINQTGNGLDVHLPSKLPDAVATVLALKTAHSWYEQKGEQTCEFQFTDADFSGWRVGQA